MPSRPSRRFRVVTKHQVSGWQFLLHRIEHALVRRDASMIDDPQRGRSTALMVGVALACVAVGGAAVLAFFKPAKPVGDAKIIADQDSGALYVKVGDRMDPVLNLASARLILGSPENPQQVKHDEIVKYPRGPWVGIPGAPGTMVDTGGKDSDWTVCDNAQSGAAAPVNPETGLPALTYSAVRTTAIGGPLTVEPGVTSELTGNQARLLRDQDTTWLVYNDPSRGVVKASIDLKNTAVTLALGIDDTTQVVAASRGLIRAIPEAPPIGVPQIPGAGQTVSLKPDVSAVVGSVLTSSNPGRGASYYVVTQDGLLQVSPVLAAILRNADTRGAVSSSTVSPNVVAENMRTGGWPGTASYPEQPVQIVDPTTQGVTCYAWSRAGTDPRSATRMLVGRQLPVPKDQQDRPVGLVTAAASHGNTADAAYLPGTPGRFVQVTGGNPGSPLQESLFWISDSGVRYGIATEAGKPLAQDPTVKALGLSAPVPAPWNIVSLFAVGPSLSVSDAKIEHDGIAPDSKGAALPGGTS